jgi:cysteine desulfurase
VTYLDHAAVTPMRPEALAAVREALLVSGNPSSVHAAGRAARELLDVSRQRVARALGARPAEVVFTSGATEGAALAIRGALGAAPAGRREVVHTAVEHPCVRDLARTLAAGGVPVVEVPVDGRGLPDLAALDRAVGERTALVCAMLANNETGVLLPVPEVAALARRRGALLLCDAVQAAGKIPVDPGALGADLVLVTGQKFGGPRGAGALWIRPGVALAPVAGGHQERGRRAGTENLPGIAGLAAALEVAVARREEETARTAALRQRLESGLAEAVPGLRLNGAGAPRLPGIASLRFPDADGDALLIALDLEGICASAGAACTSGSTRPSHVLSAMGLSPAEARATLRFSLGWCSEAADVERALEAVPRLLRQVRAPTSAPLPR